jgi:hypothetical protein
VHTVSNITDAAGSRLKTGTRSGTLFSCSSTRYIPTIQARPNARAWRAWRSALALWATEEDQLTVPLGAWLVLLPEAQRFRWQWYAQGISLFASHGNKYRRFPPIRSRRKYRDYLPLGFVAVDQISVLASPCDVTVTPDILRLRRGRQSLAHVPVITIHPSPQDVAAYLSSLPHWERYLLEHVTSDLTFLEIEEFLSEYGGVRVSNRSSARSLGSFGWSLVTPEGQHLSKCSGLVYGNDPSSKPPDSWQSYSSY